MIPQEVAEAISDAAGLAHWQTRGGIDLMLTLIIAHDLPGGVRVTRRGTKTVVAYDRRLPRGVTYD